MSSSFFLLTHGEWLRLRMSLSGADVPSHSLRSPNRIYIRLLRYCRVMESDSESEFSYQARLIVSEAKEGQV